MVLRDLLDEAAARLFIQNEVLDVVEEALLIAEPADCGLKRNNASFSLAIDSLPLEEVFPLSAYAPYLRVAPVREHDEGVRDESLWNCGLVVAEVFVVRILEVLV